MGGRWKWFWNEIYKELFINEIAGYFLGGDESSEAGKSPPLSD